MVEHRWSGWPGAWCLDCGCDDPREVAMATGDYEEDENGYPLPKDFGDQMICKEPGSNRFNPYVKNHMNGDTS